MHSRSADLEFEQYAAEEQQKRKELAGCKLSDFEMRVTLGELSGAPCQQA